MTMTNQNKRLKTQRLLESIDSSFLTADPYIIVAGNTPNIPMFGCTRTPEEWDKLISRANNKFNKNSFEVGKNVQEIYETRVNNYLKNN